VVLLSGPRPRAVSYAALRGIVSGIDPEDPRSVETGYLELYGIAPRMASDREAPGDEGPRSGSETGRAGSTAGADGTPSVLVLDHWIVSREYLSDLEELFAEMLSQHDALPVRLAREIAESDERYVPRTVWRPVLAELESTLGLERSGSTLKPRGRGAGRHGAGGHWGGRQGAGRRNGNAAADEPGAGPGAGGPAAGGPAAEPRARRADVSDAGRVEELSPAERAVLDEVVAAGTSGEHVKSPRMARAADVVRRLVERGVVVKLGNGRLYSKEAFERLAALVDQEIDDRRGAALWAVSRNTARGLIAAMVADGLLARSSPRTATPVRGTAWPDAARDGEKRGEGDA
jgi:hypothetical protein